MTDNSQKPSAVILGGLNTFSRALASFLVPVDAEPLVSRLRIVDKFSVAPPTTYLGAEFPKTLSNPLVEYRQANLTVPSAVSAALEPADGHEAFDYIFDFTGEIRHDRTEMIQIKTTCHVARLIGLEAAKRKNKAYIRIQLPFYETSSKGTHDEKEDVKPQGVIGTWWHETLRMLAAIPDLNLVILRIGFAYGPYVNIGNITSAITVGAVYGYTKKPMKSMWSPGKNPTHTIHVDDVAGAAWACAQWIGPLGRSAANAAAGEVIPFHNDKNKVKEVEGMPAHNEKLVAPLFNLVDDSNSTLLSVGQTITSYFGTTFEFFNLVESTKLKLADDAVEDINEHHVGGWTEMITSSNPPVPNTPLSAYMDTYALEKHVAAFSNTKIRGITGYQLKYPAFNHATLKEIIDKWKAEGSWPVLE
ncbi:NAD(P)-binding protein [Pluteus cervinus]|uniref:NAD(P)-binding protein n=1 Tax=Pluteus cervinus TaxID=181527 RepID=A0ACD3AQA9_9AGAR|nr:NAD(P)-binding protein [Pluteus cervinus]